MRNKYIIAFLAICVAHLALLSKLTFFPYPEFFIYPYLTNIGLLPYEQILDQHFLGLMFFPINLATLGFDTPQEFLKLHLSIVLLNQFLLFTLTTKIFKTKKAGFLASFLYFLLQPFYEGNVFWIDSFLPSIFMLSALFLILFFETKKTKHLILSGLTVGFSLILKQVALPLIGVLFIYIALKTNLKKAIPWGFFACLFTLIMLVHVISLGVFDSFFYWTVTFNLTTYRELGRKFASISQLIGYSFIFLPAILIGFVSWFRKSVNSKIIIIFMLFSLLFAFARFDYIHLQPSLPFAIIIFTSLLIYLPKALSNSIVIIFVLITSNFLLQNTIFWKTGGIRFFGQKEQKLITEVYKYASEGDTIFSQGTTPHIYTLTNTRPPGDVFVYHFPWFLVEAEEKLLKGLTQDPPKVIIQDNTASVDDNNLNKFMPNINKYISKNYTKINEIEDINVLIPN